MAANRVVDAPVNAGATKVHLSDPPMTPGFPPAMGATVEGSLMSERLSQHGSMTPEEVGRQIKVTDEAVRTGVHAAGGTGAIEPVAMRAALEAAVPHLQVQAEVPDCQACVAADVGVMTQLPHICGQVDREALRRLLFDWVGGSGVDEGALADAILALLSPEETAERTVHHGSAACGCWACENP